MTQIGNMFVGMKPSMWWYSIGPTEDNFISLLQLHMLIIGQPDKMLRDLRHTKGSTQLYAMSMWIVGSADNHNVSDLVFSLCMSVLGQVQDTSRSLLYYSHSSHFCWSNHQLKACQTTSSIDFQAFSNFASLVLYHPWLCSNILKPTLYFFLYSGHLNWYMHNHSLAQAEPPLLGGNLSPL
jgi:hypothetical protein